MVDVGGRRIHLWIEGEGEPAVVLIPACGESSIDFAALLPKLAGETRTVIFDRAGLGWSDPVWKPMAMLDAARDLHTALHRAGIAPPYILAGHSLGGFVVRLFCAAYPEEVADIVLIDSSHPGQQDVLPAYHWRTAKWTMLRRVQWFGLRRLAKDLGVTEPESGAVPPEHSDTAVALYLNDRRRRTSWWEVALRAQIGAEVRRRARPFGDIPLTVLTRARSDSEASVPFGVWYQLQADLAAQSTDSKHIVAERAGHYIHHDEPELVVETILDLVRRARA